MWLNRDGATDMVVDMFVHVTLFCQVSTAGMRYPFLLSLKISNLYVAMIDRLPCFP